MADKGEFQITSWNESTEKTFEDGGKLATAKVTQTYQGDINGESEVHYLMQYEACGNASFVGYEQITGTIKDEPCALMVKHDGNFKQGVARSTFTILADSTPDTFIGKQGRFEATEGGKAHYVIE